MSRMNQSMFLSGLLIGTAVKVAIVFAMVGMFIVALLV